MAHALLAVPTFISGPLAWPPESGPAWCLVPCEKHLSILPNIPDQFAEIRRQTAALCHAELWPLGLVGGQKRTHPWGPLRTRIPPGAYHVLGWPRPHRRRWVECHHQASFIISKVRECIWVCAPWRLFLATSTYTYTYLYMYACTYIYIYVHSTHLSIYMHTFTCVYIYVYVHVKMCTHVLFNVYICMYICANIHSYSIPKKT